MIDQTQCKCYQKFKKDNFTELSHQNIFSIFSFNQYLNASILKQLNLMVSLF